MKYEDLLKNPITCLQRALLFYDFPVPENDKLQKIVDEYSFKNIANRNRGEEDKNNFVRKGISGDWKNYFNPESCQTFKKYAGDELIEMGYTDDLNWTNRII